MVTASALAVELEALCTPYGENPRVSYTQIVNNTETAGPRQKSGAHHNKEHQMELRATAYNEWPPTELEWSHQANQE